MSRHSTCSPCITVVVEVAEVTVEAVMDGYHEAATGEAGEADFSHFAPAMPALECLKTTSLGEAQIIASVLQAR